MYITELPTKEGFSNASVKGLSLANSEKLLELFKHIQSESKPPS